MKKNICMILCLVWSFIMIGCSNKDEGTAMNIYYLDPEGYGLVQDEYFRNAEEPEAAVEEVLYAMQNPKDIKEFQTTIPSSVKIEKFRLKDNILDLTFDEEYLELSKSIDVLLRASVVQTMVQIPGVEYVSFYVGDEPLLDSSGNAMGMMCAEDFAQNTGSSLKSYQETDLRLYFASKEGTKLTLEKRMRVHYNINTSIEKLVVEQLMKGSNTDKKNTTIPNTVKLLGVSVKDGICYVNFDSAFLTDGYNQKPEVAIYSIVNSIIANGNVAKVQILVDGSTDVKFKGTVDLSEPLEWKADLIEEKSKE